MQIAATRRLRIYPAAVRCPHQGQGGRLPQKIPACSNIEKGEKQEDFFHFSKASGLGCLPETTMAFGVRPSAIKGRLKGNRFVRHQSPIAARSSA